MLGTTDGLNSSVLLGCSVAHRQLYACWVKKGMVRHVYDLMEVRLISLRTGMNI
jgi:hypothetical protein